MSKDEYRLALEAAAREYEALGQERQRIDQRLGELAQTIGTLTRLCGLTPTVPWGLTDACRTVLRSAGLAMTPTEVRERLAAIGCDLSSYSNPLASVHTVLKRLNESGELRFITTGHGKVAYIWNRPPRAAMLGPDIARVMQDLEERDRPETRRRKTSRT
jgi:hypothetical protein